MDPKIISALENASTSAEFAAAIEAIPREQKYYNEQIRDIILQKKTLIADSASADTVSRFVLDFLDKDLPHHQENSEISTRVSAKKHLIVDSSADAVTDFFYHFSRSPTKHPLLKTPEIRDLVISTLAPKVSAGDSVYHLGSLICSLLVIDKASAELYSTTESFKAILSCFHCATTAESARWIAVALNNIFSHNPSSNKLLNDFPGVVESFDALLPHATTAEAAAWIINALEKALRGNEELQQKFASQQWIDNIKRMERLCSSRSNGKFLLGYLVDPQSVIIPLQNASTSSEFAAAVNAIPIGQKFYSDQVRDIILGKKDLITDSLTADAVIELFDYFSFEESRRPLLRIPEISNLVINILAPKASAGYSVHHLGSMICNIVRDKPSAGLYSTNESFKEFLSCFHRATTPSAAGSITRALSNILQLNPRSNKLFNDVPGVVDALIALVPQATTDEAASGLLWALKGLLKGNEPAQKMLSSHYWVTTVSELESKVSKEIDHSNAKLILDLIGPTAQRRAPFEIDLSSSTSSSSLVASINKIINDKNPTPYWLSIIKIFLTKKHLIQDEESTITAGKFIEWYVEKSSSDCERKLITESHEIFQFLELILFPEAVKSNSKKTLHAVYQALTRLFQLSTAACDYFSKSSFVSTVTRTFPLADESCLECLRWLLTRCEVAQSVFGTPEFRSAFIGAFKSSFGGGFFSSVSPDYKQILEILENPKRQPELHP